MAKPSKKIKIVVTEVDGEVRSMIGFKTSVYGYWVEDCKSDAVRALLAFGCLPVDEQGRDISWMKDIDS